MRNDIDLTICIPTNGIVEWVFPVLDSIFQQKDADSLRYEVIVTDNGNNSSFKAGIKRYEEKYSNLKYYENHETGFLNQVACFKKARGKFVKFINHRMLMLPGSVQYLLEYVEEAEADQTPIYFSNGVLDKEKRMQCCSFDEFISKLSIYTTWSGGLAYWNTERILTSTAEDYNALFPHFYILSMETDRTKYYIDDHELTTSVSADETKKGVYDFYYAFAVEFPSLLLQLNREGKIDIQTFLSVKRELLEWIADQFINYRILRTKTAYDLSNFPQTVYVYWGNFEFWKRVTTRFCSRVLGRVFQLKKWR